MENLCFSESSQFRQFWFEKVDRLSLNEKIQVAYEFLKWRKVLPTMQKQSSKSAAKATEYKNLGNNEFRCKNYIEAANFYTKSVSVAPVPSTELAIAYANRSAVMAKLTRDRECLLDINRALQLNYPETGKQKLLDRKNKCIIQFRIAMSVAVSIIICLWKYPLPFEIGCCFHMNIVLNIGLKGAPGVLKIEIKQKICYTY